MIEFAMKRIMCVFGTRPEAIKMSPVIRRLLSDPRVECLTCVTAQHREMLDQVLALFDIRPNVDLNLMRANQSLAQITSLVLDRLDPVIREHKPDWILAQGDTTTVMATALLSYYHRIRFGHVEAGLRTLDKYQPFPEEINRRVAGVIADLHFAPTEWSRANLLREGVPANNIIVTGNPVIDALQWVAELPFDISSVEKLGIDLQALEKSGKNIILVTAHRRENFGQPLENICEAMLSLANSHAGAVHFIYPVHLNPNVQEPVNRLLSNHPHITLVPPLDYLPLINVLKRSKLVLTDSGGLQEEAPGLGVPVLVLRDVTERPEGVEAGTVQLVGTDPEKIVNSVDLLLKNPEHYERMSRSVNPYGDGKASQRILEAIMNYDNR
jgi:UDP-N-acetylglucosamine 2-epimerase (non-hydrolysing)